MALGVHTFPTFFLLTPHLQLTVADFVFVVDCMTVLE